jgi:hypothetical protein
VSSPCIPLVYSPRANFSPVLTILTGGCAFTPITDDDKFGIVGAIFSRDEISITPPKNTAVVSSNGNATVIASDPSSGISIPVVAAVAGGVGLLFVIASILFLLYYIQERRFQRAQFQTLFEMKLRRGYVDRSGVFSEYYHQPPPDRPHAISGYVSDSDTATEPLPAPYATQLPGVLPPVATGAPRHPPVNSALDTISGLPSHPGAFKSRKKGTEAWPLPPPSGATFFTQKGTPLMSPLSYIADFTSSRTTHPPGPHTPGPDKGKKRHAIRRFINKEGGESESDGHATQITGPMWEGRSQELPLRNQVHLDQMMKQVPVSVPNQVEERPLASGKSLLYGW